MSRPPDQCDLQPDDCVSDSALPAEVSRKQRRPTHVVKRAIDADLDGGSADRLGLVIKLEGGNVPIRMETRLRGITVERL